MAVASAGIVLFLTIGIMMLGAKLVEWFLADDESDQGESDRFVNFL